MLAGGSSTAEIVSQLELRYEESPEALAEATSDLVRELRQEELLEELPEGATPEPSQNGAASNGAPAARASFERPALNKYTDMQYFLLLDPIHEVDAVGWPNPPEQPTP